MIKRSRLSKIWKRTIVHLLIVDVVAVAILTSFILKRMQTSAGPTPLGIAMLFVVVLVGSGVFFLFARSIKNAIGRRYGED